ncbi:Hypothetical predicted protein [Mytilus galloprovincialis]|uniref:Uncharacterized protein n=1 Tax=Mytilus galloprovincialis TaxID=29158 RepID=A0A8B6C0L0_MYTGA|nr:Hypothetical predicted protein [Mytilus galloprovincialis]
MSDYLTEEEIANMVKAFNDMEIRPSASSPEEFKTWLEEYKDDDDALDAYIPRISMIPTQLNTIYGVEALLGQFYTARQHEDEDVASWGCRLEDILRKATDRGKFKQRRYEQYAYI